MLRKIILSTTLSCIISSSAFASKTIERAGDIVQLALPAAAGLYTLYKQDYTGTKQLLCSGLANTAVVYGLKYTFNARRPNGGKHSFPSGHTAISFASSTFMWKRYGPELGVPSTLLASFVGISRIESRKHFARDVAAGAAIGIAAAYIFTDKLQENIVVNGNTVGVKFSF